jgi:hypothetical protein
MSSLRSDEDKGGKHVLSLPSSTNKKQEKKTGKIEKKERKKGNNLR